jgi:hypothetical protein
VPAVDKSTSGQCERLDGLSAVSGALPPGGGGSRQARKVCSRAANPLLHHSHAAVLAVVRLDTVFPSHPHTNPLTTSTEIPSTNNITDPRSRSHTPTASLTLVLTPTLPQHHRPSSHSLRLARVACFFRTPRTPAPVVSKPARFLLSVGATIPRTTLNMATHIIKALSPSVFTTSAPKPPPAPPVKIKK